MPVIDRPPDEKAPNPNARGDDKAVKLWENRLRLAEKKLKKKGGGDIKSSDWGKLVAFYEGEQWKGLGPEKGSFHRVTANQAKSNIDSIRPLLYFQNPKVRIRLKNPTLAPAPIPFMDPATGMPAVDPATGQPQISVQAGAPVAKIGDQFVNAQKQVDLLEAIDNYYFGEMDAKSVIRRNINDALVLPYGVCRLEWVVEMETVEEPDPLQPGVSKKVERVVAQYPRLTRVKPWCFLWDTELDEFNVENGARWLAEIKYYSKQDLEGDPLLDVDFNEIGEATAYVDDEYEGDDPSKADDDVRRYKTYEIHDLASKRFMVWVQGSKKFNRVEDPSYYSMVEGPIYTVLGFDETPGDSFPLPVLKQIITESQAYNLILSAQVNHVFRNNRKYQILEGSLSPDEKAKLETGADGAIIETKQNGAVGIIPDASITQDSYAVAPILKREISEKIGVSAYSRNAREPGVDTAFEASLIQGGSDTKIQEKRDIVREFARRLVRKLNQILKAYADQATVTEIVGLGGTEWVQWSNRDIAGEFVEDVDIYTGAIYSRETDKKQWMELLSIANGNPYVNQQRLWEKVFRVFEEGVQLLNTPEEMAAAQAAQAEQQAVEESKRQDAKNYRPSDGEVRRGTDMKADIMGQARRGE